MSGLLRRLLNYDVVDDVLEIASSQQAVIDDQRKIIGFQQKEIGRLKLEYTRWGRSVIEEFLIALDKPEYEDELREKLADALVDLSDEVARIEEHATY